ncbi:MAG: ROK family protein [bacterium]|nr:ROK family protein [bacterium]
MAAKHESAVMGIDIGGSGIKGAPVDVERGVLLEERLRIPTPQPARPKAVAGVVADLVRHFGWTGPVGCAFPAVIDDGVMRTAANVDKSWIGTDGRELFERRTNCRVTLLNDADAAGLAEMLFGAGRARQGLVIMLTLGTGIGSALFMDGHLVPNTELGHLIVRGQAAEKRASASARKEQALPWEKWAGHLDEYLHILEDLLNPKLFILGGGVSKKHEKYLHYITADTPVVPAEMRNDAGIVGAALAAK